MNRVVLIGNLTRDVEVRYTASGTAVAELGLAVNERVKKGEEWVDEPVFVDVTVWGRMAEVAGEYCSKGSKVGIDGRLKLDSWEKDGQKRSKLRVTADKVELLTPKGDGVSGGGRQREEEPAHAGSRQEASGSSGGYDDEDIPF